MATGVGMIPSGCSQKKSVGFGLAHVPPWRYRALDFVVPGNGVLKEYYGNHRYIVVLCGVMLANSVKFLINKCFVFVLIGVECALLLFRQVKITLDSEATSFTQQNAYFFAEMSESIYKPEGEVKLFLENNGFWGSGGTAGDNFEWFEVCVCVYCVCMCVSVCVVCVYLCVQSARQSTPSSTCGHHMQRRKVSTGLVLLVLHCTAKTIGEGI